VSKVESSPGQSADYIFSLIEELEFSIRLEAFYLFSDLGFLFVEAQLCCFQYFLFFGLLKYWGQMRVETNLGILPCLCD